MIQCGSAFRPSFTRVHVEGLKTSFLRQIFAVGSDPGSAKALGRISVFQSAGPFPKVDRCDIVACSAGTDKPGEMLMIGGNLLSSIATSSADAGFLGLSACVDRRSLICGGPVCTGRFGPHMVRKEPVRAFDADGRAALWEKAAAIPVGGTGLLTLDYLMATAPYREQPLSQCDHRFTIGACRQHTDRRSKVWR
jgi:hypothetical protein